MAHSSCAWYARLRSPEPRPYGRPPQVGILDPANPEELELVFSCLVFLFKFLAKQLVADIDHVYRSERGLAGAPCADRPLWGRRAYFVGLLCHKKTHIRRFAAESFAFLVRKVRSERMERVLNALLAPPHEDSGAGGDAFSDGVATLLFETVRGVEHGFHSCAPELLAHAVRFLSPFQTDTPDGKALAHRALRRRCFSACD